MLPEEKTQNITTFSNSTFCGGATEHPRDKVECIKSILLSDIKTVSKFKQLNGNTINIKFTIRQCDTQNTNKKH